MALSHKLMRDLIPGDVVQLLRPSGRGRVTASKACEYAKVNNMDRRLEGSDPGWIIDFEFVDGTQRGRREYVYGLPSDKVRLG